MKSCICNDINDAKWAEAVRETCADNPRQKLKPPLRYLGHRLRCASCWETLLVAVHEEFSRRLCLPASDPDAMRLIAPQDVHAPRQVVALSHEPV